MVGEFGRNYCRVSPWDVVEWAGAQKVLTRQCCNGISPHFFTTTTFLHRNNTQEVGKSVSEIGIAMVIVRKKRQRQHNKLQFLNAQTIVTLTISATAFLLLSFEPTIVHDSSFLSLPRGLQEVPIGDGADDPPIIRVRKPRSAILPRYGMVPRTALRTDTFFAEDAVYSFGAVEDLQSDEVASHDYHVSQPQSPISNSDSMQSNSKSFPPRIVLLDDYDSFPSAEKRAPSKGGHQMELPEQQLLATTDIEPLPYEHIFLEECESPLQPKVHPTCNHLHELEITTDYTALLSAKGSWRSAWTVGNNTAVLKILHLKRDFNEEAYAQHALDVMVSDMLTSSPYVINAFGFCGQSILQEFAPSSARDFVKSYEIRNRKRLRIARDMARGLADLQSLQSNDFSGPSEEVTTHPTILFAHNDINIANTIQVEGRVKWNDFNIGILLRNRKGSNHTQECGAPAKFRADLWRSPEEIWNTTYVQPQYSDMYMFGNILYQTMTRHQPWTHKEPVKLTVEDVAARKREGGLPTFPEQYKNTTNKDLQTMMLATYACYHPNPSKRLTAYELANALGFVYDKLQRKQKVTYAMLRKLFLSK